MITLWRSSSTTPPKSWDASPVFWLTAFILAAVSGYTSPYYTHQIFAGLTLGAFILSWQIGRKIHPVAGLCLFWTLAQCIRMYLNPFGLYVPIAGDILKSIRGSAGEGIAITLLIAAPFLAFPRRVPLRVMFLVLALMDATLVLLQTLHGGGINLRGGFFFNPSLNACILAVLTPFVLGGIKSSPLRIASLCLIGGAVVAAHSVTGMVAFALALAVTYISRRTVIALPLVLLGTIPFASSQLLSPVKGFFSDSGRFEVWSYVIDFFTRFSNKFIGLGQGTAVYLVPAIQQMNAQKLAEPKPYSAFIWLHNEWLQVMFEQGVIGLALFSGLFVICLYKAKDQYLRASMFMIGVICLVQYPFRMPVTALLMTLIAFLCLKPQNKY